MATHVQFCEAKAVMADKSEILETFWGLASLEESERLAAAQKLLTTLVETQVWSQ